VIIEIQRFERATELRDVAEPFLMRNEAHHNLILGLLDRRAGEPVEKVPGRTSRRLSGTRKRSRPP